MSDPNARQGNDLRQLVDEATQLRTLVNVFVGRATAARITLPRSIIDAAGELLLLPDRLIEAAERGESHAAFRDGMRRAAEEHDATVTRLRPASERGEERGRAAGSAAPPLMTRPHDWQGD